MSKKSVSSFPSFSSRPLFWVKPRVKTLDRLCLSAGRRWLHPHLQHPKNAANLSWSTIWVFPKIGVFPPKWMVYNGKPYENGWFRGYHYFRKHPFNIDKPILFVMSKLTSVKSKRILMRCRLFFTEINTNRIISTKVVEMNTISRWFNSWPFYPLIGGLLSLNPLKGHLYSHPKKVTAWITRIEGFFSVLLCNLGTPTN